MDTPAVKKRILVIEDEPLICRVCVKTLTNDGYDVDVAVSGLAGMEMADRKEYDLYFSDIRTPSMNGMDFYRFLHGKDARLARRVVFTTGDVMSPDVRAFLAENRNPCLPKPFTPADIRMVVGRAIASLEEVPTS